ncbi:glycoside hydrolase family 3 N-terminal domain-containing protein [Vallicoccus soli]|uniref:beta-N-acetylhexosaminidase n=1 Tax=Vallicoccus soli TaxID=2339232 RepID=A0A3A3Z1A5_9ACTN|nr:glycoside hydrolase family 3 N-terminal domain-containing protein [Vallicoccus soli]RJK97035.1 glycoside hydrolase family 3 protein [Vallicoccus soli]
MSERPPRPRRGRRAGLVLAVVAAVAGAGAPAPATAAAAGDPVGLLQRMTEAQRVGQLFMVGTPATGLDARTAAAVRERHVGSAILTGRSAAGVDATARLTRGLRALGTRPATAGAATLVATDQEGGAVQVLSGPGFSAIPSALAQSRLGPAEVRRRAGYWGRQLRRAGVHVDLAPVLDTVGSPAAAAANPPIGRYARNYGYGAASAARGGGAFAQGLADAGVAATGKHFPGLGRVTANTDTTAGVVDTVTGRADPSLEPFRGAVRAGLPMLMLSSATYARIDRYRPAVLSPAVVRGMVRGDLGFDGVVVSDDLGRAAQVQRWDPATRARSALLAGGDLVLTVDPGVLPAMYDAVLSRAAADAAFSRSVSASALRVLRLKQRLGLLPPAVGPTYLLDDELGPSPVREVRYGRAVDETLVGDWDGDGVDTLGVRTGDRYLLTDGPTGPATRDLRIGRPGDQALVGDWDGDGADSIALRRGDLVFVRDGLEGPFRAPFRFGRAADEVVAGRWAPGGRDSLALRRGDVVSVTDRLGGPVTSSRSFGRAGDDLLVGDWDGDGQDTLGVRRGPRTFLQAAPGGPATTTVTAGVSSDLPLVGDWDGDGSDGLGLRR